MIPGKQNNYLHFPGFAASNKKITADQGKSLILKMILHAKKKPGFCLSQKNWVVILKAVHKAKSYKKSFSDEID